MPSRSDSKPADRCDGLPLRTPIMNGAYLSTLLFLIVSALGSLYLLIEAILQSLGKSICATEGCKVVAQYSRFGDLAMVLLGFAMVSSIAVLAARGMRSQSVWRERLVDVLLCVSLAGEGFFIGYQLFWLHAVCVFCLSVFGLFVVLGALRMLAGHREVLAGFAALFAILGLFYLLLPAGGTALPLDNKYILFYSADCKHCAEVRKELEDRKFAAVHLPVREYSAFLKNMGIEYVPTLMVNGPYEKIFLTGSDAIRTYLSSCQQPATSSPQAVRKTKAAPAGRESGTGQPAGQLNLFVPSIGPDQVFNPRPDDGLCKEDVKCD